MSESSSSAVPSTTATDPYAPFRHRDYRRFIAMVALTTIAQQAQGVAIGWNIYERTGSALALGWAGLAQFLPVFAFFLPAGQLADRHERRRIVVASLLVWSASAALLAWAAWSRADVGWIYFALTCIGAVVVVNRAARDALLPQLLPQSMLVAAVTWNSSVFQIASVSGPVIAGFLIAWTGNATTVYLANLVCILLSAGLVVSIRHRPLTHTRPPASWMEMFAGLTHVWRTKVVWAMMVVDLVAVLLGGATALLPIYAKDILAVGPAGLGWLSAAPAVGAALMATTQTHRPPFRHAGSAFLWSVAIFGAAVVVFGVSRWFWLSFAALLVVGASDNVSAVIRQTAVQLYTPDELRGRVSAVNRVFISSSNELGALESGMLAAATGPVFTVVFGGVATLAIAAAGVRLFPDLRRLVSFAK